MLSLADSPMDFDKFLEVLRALAREGVDYVLVGAVALGIHGLVRATEDVDLFIRPDGENVERLKRALRSVWDDPEIAGITAQDLAGEYPTVRYGPPGEGFVIDLRRDAPKDLDVHDIRSVVDRSPLVRPDIFKLCRWIADYYVSPLGEVLKAALPPGILPKHVERGGNSGDRRNSGSDPNFLGLQKIGSDPEFLGSRLFPWLYRARWE